MRVRVTRVDPSLPLPAYATAGATGIDLSCREDVMIAPGEIARIPANVIVAVPYGYVMIVVLRSGTPRRTGLVSPGGIGIIDQDYQGPEDEIRVQVFNPGAMPVTVCRGDRIAQALFLPLERVEWDEQGLSPGPSRGGFGSTDWRSDDPPAGDELQGEETEQSSREDEIHIVHGAIPAEDSQEHENGEE